MAIMKKILIVFLCYAGCLSLADAQQVIELYKGQIPGNEGVTGQERISYTQSGEIASISGVTVPAITVYLPDPNKATGTAVILCPGGGLRMLSWQNDVINMARWLNERGIAAIGLKYRLQTSNATPGAGGSAAEAAKNNPLAAMNLKITDFDKITNANANPNNSKESLKAIDNSISDAVKAIRMVRENASDWKINPNKVGFLGFSAGGGVSLGATIRAEEGTMPNFICTAYGPSLIDVKVPKNAPKLFICTRANHPNVAAGLLSLFLVWEKAGASAELYIYDDGRSGFGPSDTGTTSGTWRESFYRWLTSNGF
jgi:dienelactone hydrolase